MGHKLIMGGFITEAINNNLILLPNLYINIYKIKYIYYIIPILSKKYEIIVYHMIL